MSSKNSQYKKTRFMYKFHMIIRDEDGNIIKEGKYCTAKSCSDDNKGFLSDRQIVLRIVNNYKFSEYFTKYDNVSITKIREIIPSIMCRKVISL
jgi:hypothetical protein